MKFFKKLDKLFFKIRINKPHTNPRRRAELYKKYLAKIGENCEIFRNVSFCSEPYLIKLGDNVKITYGVRFITHDGGAYVIRNIKQDNNIHLYGQIIVGSNVFIGENSMILPGAKIGNNVIIGAGSIVTKSIPDNSVAAGVPAKVIGSIDNYIEKNINKKIETGELTEEEKRKLLIQLSSESNEKFISK